MAKQIVPDSQTQDVGKLRSAVEVMDAISQEGFSEISAIATLALAALETLHGCNDIEIIARTLGAIKRRAEDSENYINSEAEQVGCDWRDTSAARRREARAAASGIFLGKIENE